MSNQLGLMLSSIFLAIFIIFSGEILTCQQISAKAMAATNELGIYVEKNGYKYGELTKVDYENFFDKIVVHPTFDTNNNVVFYTITTYVEYDSFSNIFSYLDHTITCKITVCRKL